MAALDSTQLAQARRKAEGDISNKNYPKSTINAAFQAAEDWWETNKSSLATAVNAATSPRTFTVGEKQVLLRIWMWQKFYREGGS